MFGWLSQKKAAVVFVSVMVLLLALISSHADRPLTQSGLEGALFRAGVPVLKTVEKVSGGFRALRLQFASRDRLRRENDRLKAELSLVRNLDPLKEEYRQENERLRLLLGLRENLGFPTAGGRVMRMPRQSYTPALLSIDPDAGVRQHMPVVSPAGVVGQVQGVSGSIAKVLLITDRNSGIAALIQRDRIQGIVSGKEGEGLRMEYVRRGEQVLVGDIVLTSGLDGIYPKGIVIGTVTFVSEEADLTQRVDLRPAVDFQRLEEVLILLREAEEFPGKEPDGGLP